MRWIEAVGEGVSLGTRGMFGCVAGSSSFTKPKFTTDFVQILALVETTAGYECSGKMEGKADSCRTGTGKRGWQEGQL